jgi:hypothetical protein
MHFFNNKIGGGMRGGIRHVDDIAPRIAWAIKGI